MKRPSYRQAGAVGALDAVTSPERGLAHEAAESVRPWWNRDWFLAFLLLGGTFLAYLPVWRAGFIWDDGSFVITNPLIQRVDGLWRFWFSTVPVDYFPMTSTAFWLEWQLWGANPLGYHVANVVLHAAGAVLLWRVLAGYEIPGAWLAAAIFAVHPVNVESVAWIAEQKNTLAICFYLLSFWCYSRFEPALGPSGNRALGTLSSQARWYWFSLAAFVLSLLSKTAVAPMPLVLLALVWWQRGRLERRDILRSLPFFATAAAVGLISLWFQSHRAIGSEIVRSDSFWPRMAGAGWAVWFYLYKAVLPLDLRAIYPRWQIDGGQWLSYMPTLLVLGGFLACWQCRRSWGRAALLGLSYFVLMLLPVLGFLNISFMQYSLVADRWQYYAIIGPITLGAAILTRALARVDGSKEGGRHEQAQGATPHRIVQAPCQVIPWVVCGVLLLVLGGLTWRQCGRFADAETFWRTVLAEDPNAWVGHHNLGKALADQGRADEAMDHFRKALDIRPDYAMAHYNLGELLNQRGQVDEAMAHFQRALEIQPRYADAHNNLAIALIQKGKLDEAMTHFQQALAIQPDDAEVHNNLAGVLSQKGRVEEAIVHFQKALEIQPDYPAACGGLAWLLATCPQASVRSGARAVELAERADRLSGGSNPAFSATLAAAYAEVGRFSEAIASAERALALAIVQDNQVLAANLKRQLGFYQSKLPFRDAGHL